VKKLKKGGFHVMIREQKQYKGFTIIEVVLVLAIAGLIFLMVFLALPALQRAQRDTQRKEDISRFMTAVTHYEANNRGAIPNFTSSASPEVNWWESKQVGKATGVPCDVDPNGLGPKFPDSFCGRYLIVQGANDQFADPDGTPYVIKPANVFPESNAGTTWNVTTIAGSSSGALVTAKVGGQDGVTINNTCKATDCAPTVAAGSVDSTNHGGYSAYGYVIHVVYSATCSGEVAIKSSGARKFAVLYKLEGGGVMCQSN
jgi:prepilin-type N-terminal cleavage/methylation domain-containing protein